MSDIWQNKYFSKLNKDFVKNIKVFYSVHDKLHNGEFDVQFFVTKDDLVYGLGKNIYGLLNNKEVTEPTIITELCNKQIIDFNNGSFHCIARSIDGKLYSFGTNAFNQLGYEIENKSKIIESLINENVIQVCCGAIRTIVLTQNGEVFGWGHKILVKNGINSEVDFESIPTKIIGFNGEKIQSISCGVGHSMALTVTGNVFSWGSNMFGQLGINNTYDSFSPQFIKIKDKKVLFKKISCGQHHSLLLTTNGDIYSFGSNQYNQLGYETNKANQLIPRMIETKQLMHFSDICCDTNGNISAALSSTDGFCYILGYYKFRPIKSPQKTEYKSCEEAIFDMTGNTMRAFNCEEGVVSPTAVEKCSKV